MDRFSVAFEGEYREDFNACRRCGEENCECPRACRFDPNILNCSKAHECEGICWDEEEEDEQADD